MCHSLETLLDQLLPGLEGGHSITVVAKDSSGGEHCVFYLTRELLHTACFADSDKSAFIIQGIHLGTPRPLIEMVDRCPEMPTYAELVTFVHSNLYVLKHHPTITIRLGNLLLMKE